MKTILIIDDMPFCREVVAKALRRSGYEVLAAAGAVEGLEILATRHVDLVVLDNEMPQMPGIVFLQQLRESGMWPNLPVIMLTGSSDRQTVLAAKGFGAAEYLLKSDSVVVTLLARVNKLMTPDPAPPAGPPAPSAPARVERNTEPAAAPRPRPPVATPTPVSAKTTWARVLSAIDTLGQNRTLGGVVAQIVTLAGSPRGSLADLVAIVRQDPLIAARVLHAANSAAFATAKPHITSIEEAIRNVGAGTVRTLAMSAGIFDAFPVGRADGADLLRCWQHGLAVAGLMDRIVPASLAPAGVPYLIGLCHDMDEILLRQRFPDAYAGAVAAAAAAGVPVQQVLPDIFGISREDLVQRLLTVLGMPDATAAPIEQYTANAGRMLDSHHNVLVRALAICNYHANALQLASSPEALVSPVRAKACEQLTPESIDAMVMRSEIIASVCALARLSANEETALLRPLLPQTETRVCYVRHPALSERDPVEAALRLLCDIKVASRLPAEAQLTDVDIVLVAAGQAEAAGYGVADLESLAGKRGRRHVLLLPRRPDGQPKQGNVELIQYPLSLASLRDAIRPDRVEIAA